MSLIAVIVDGLKCVDDFHRSYEDSPEEAIKLCQILLEEPDIDSSVRLGNLYGFIIEHFHRKGNFNMVS